LPLLQSLSYPHKLISIAFGEDSSHDGTLHAADEIAEELRKSFASVKVFHFNLTGQVGIFYLKTNNNNNNRTMFYSGWAG
jgi:hypothetical protein